jgi:4-amino-4-deoxy-L-arabinose transferase-like glycosyltransferase
MLVSGDWWHTTLNGVDRFDKPIGVYWLQAISAGLLGGNEFAYRLPSALSGWIASVALGFFAFQKWGVKAAVLAGLISATSLGPWAMARTATADALLGLFFVLIFLDLWRALEFKRLFYSRRLSVWVGLGLLVKGPVAVVVPLGTLIIYYWNVPDARYFIRKIIFDVWSWVLLLCIAMPWYIYAYWRHGQLFIDGFFLKHNVERFTGSLEGHSGSWLYFFIALPILWMPWSFLGLKALSNFHHLWQQPFLKFAWSWFGFVFIFFSLANTKLPHYLLYAAPAVCVLLTVTALNASKLSWTLTSIGGLFFLALLLCAPSILQSHTELIKNDFYISLFQNAVETQMWKWLFLLPSLLLVFFGLNAGLKKINFPHASNHYFLGFTAFVVFQSCVLGLVALPWWSRTLQSPVHELAMIVKNRPEQLVQWGVHFPSISTYRENETPKREPLPGELALVQNLKSDWPSDTVVVETRGPLSVIQLPTKKISPP